MNPAKLMCRLSLLTRKGAGRLLRHRMLTLAAALSVFLLDLHLKPPVGAEGDADFEKPALYAFEQCAGSCQIEVDERLLRCPEYQDDSENIEAQDCNAEARNLYQRCLQMCPADPRLALK